MLEQSFDEARQGPGALHAGTVSSILRNVYDRSLSLRLKAGRGSVLLPGLQQVGKSTLLSPLKPDLTVNLASPAAFREYVSQP